MIAHLFINIEIRGGRSVETCQQFIHHDQQFHLTRFIDKQLLYLLLEGLHILAVQHLFVDLILLELFGQPLAAFLALDVAGVVLIGCDDGAFMKAMRNEQLVEFAGLINTARNKHGIAMTALQTVSGFHVKQDVGNDFLKAVL